MASYTDKIPTFNPYVQQQPIDAMLKVGMYKQQKYEEGVKKIQTNIDNVAGLDIANPVQQKYLQSKLDALGNNLTFLAAGDFSDFSLVNSVNGMTKQITKDEDVINAVSSTAKLRAGYKKRSELAKKGLTDKNNDDYYDMYASDYVNSQDLKASFNTDYIPYTNIVKKLQEALVGAGESSTIAEQIFVTDQNTGKPIIGPDGHYMYADAKTINKLVTNKPAVLAAIANVFSEGDVKQQLAIDGWATYRNTEATELLQPLKTQYDNERTRLEQQSVEITAMLTSTNLSPEEKEMYTKANAEIEARTLENDNAFISLSQQAIDDPESFKQNYYSQEFKRNLLNQFLKEEDSQTYGKNEALEVQMERDKTRFDQAMKRRELAISESKLNLDYMTFYRDSEQDPITGNWNKKPEPGKSGTKTFEANNPLFTGGTSGSKVDARNIIDEDIKLLGTDKNELAKSLYVDFIRTHKNNFNLSEDAILEQAKKYAKQLGVSTEAYLDRWSLNIINKYVENGLTPPPNLLDDLNQYLDVSETLNNKVNQYNSARKNADYEAGIGEILENTLKGKPTLYFNVNGERFTITPKDMLDMTRHGYIDQFKMYGYTRNKKQMNLGEDFKVTAKVLTANQNRFLSAWFDLSPQMKEQAVKESEKYKSVIGKYITALDKSDKLFNKNLQKIVGVTDTVTGTLPTKETDEREMSVAKVTSYVNSGERNYKKGSDKITILKALKNNPTITWNAKKPTNKREEWSGEIIISDKDGNSYTINNVNQKDLATFTDAKFTQYQEKPIQDAINMNERTKSTNPVYMPNSPNAWRTAFYKGSQVNPEVIKAGWSYRADVVKTNSGGYRLVNYVRPPGTKNFITIYGAAIATDENIIDNTYKTTTPAQLNAMYLNYLHNQNKQ